MKHAAQPALRQLVFTAKDVRSAFEATLERAGGSLGIWIVLNAVSDEGFISHRILATRAHVDGATITHHVDRAEKLGLVLREVDPSDRRVKRLKLTPAGVRLHKRLVTAVDGLADQALSGISERDLAALARTLEAIRVNIDRVILAVDQGTTGTTCLAGRRRARGGRARLRAGGDRDAAARLGRAGPTRAVGERRSRRAGRTRFVRRVDARRRGARDREPARDDDPVGPRDRRAAPSGDRLAGPAARLRAAASCPRDEIRARTGLTPDPYFSATKLEWLLRETGRRDGVAFGTVDTWLLWLLTGGAVHATDPSNASRTMLLDLATLEWNDELLALFGIPRNVLPEVRAEIDVEGVLLGEPVRVRALAGDQQASLYAHGGAKATIGTGAFVLVHSGRVTARRRRTASCGPRPPAAATPSRARSSSPTAGLEWLPRRLSTCDPFTVQVDSTEGVYFVPALTGLGSPHWAPDARGRHVRPLTRARGASISSARRSRRSRTRSLDVVDALPQRPAVLRVDGGASANGFLMQFLADVLRRPVEASRRSRDDRARRRRARREAPGAATDGGALRAGARRVGARRGLARRRRAHARLIVLAAT